MGAEEAWIPMWAASLATPGSALPLVPRKNNGCVDHLPHHQRCNVFLINIALQSLRLQSSGSTLLPNFLLYFAFGTPLSPSYFYVSLRETVDFHEATFQSHVPR